MEVNTPAPKNKGGRPPTEINWDKLDTILQVFGTLEEVAAVHSCSIETIERAVEREKGMGFAEYSKQKQGVGKSSLRRKMFQVALAGNVTMLIWLSKQKSIGLNFADEQKIVFEKPKDDEALFDLLEKMDDD